MKQFNNYTARMSGFKTKEEAESSRASLESWVASFNDGSFEVASSVTQGPFGWAAEIKATKSA